MDRPVRVTVGGDVTVTGPSRRPVRLRGRQAQAVMAYLAVEDRVVQRDELAELLWGDRLSDHWQGALRGVLSKVRGALVEAGLPPTSLRSQDALVWLEVPVGVRTDTDELEAELGTDDAEVEVRIAAASRAVEVLARPFLPHLDGEWSRRRRHARAGLAARAAHRLVEALLEAGRTDVAVRAARDRVEREPLDETAQHLLIVALLADGQRVQALRAFTELTALLAAELGIAPAEATAALVRGPTVASGPAPDGASPPRVDDGGRFVGRTRELAALDAVWAEVVGDGRPTMVVVEGPAGIGKTRLALHFGDRRRREGHQVLWGRSRSGAGLAYGALAEAIEAAQVADPALVERLGARGAGLVGILPHLADRFDHYRPPRDGGVARTHLFASVTTAFSELARRPTVLVLDDLHWAAPDAVSLLEAVLDGLERPLLVLATTRAESTAHAGGLASIQRVVPVRTIALDLLSATDLVELVAEGPPPHTPADVALAAELHARTSGLPFFVTEITRAARDADAPIDPRTVPPGARDWVRRRVDALPPELARTLELAAVVGDEIDVDLLRRASGAPAAEVAGHCDALVAMGLITGGDGPGMLAFSHALSHDGVYQGIGPTRRALLHQQVAEALAVGPPSPDRSAVLAHHHRAAGPQHRGAATAHAHAAGADALAQGAWQQAGTHFADSLGSADTPVAQARARIGMGQALLRQRRYDEARPRLREAVEIAVSNGLPLELADATLALVGRAGRGADLDRAGQVQQLRAALAQVEALDPAGPSIDRGQRRSVLLSHLERELAVSLLLTTEVDERNRLLDSALARARDLPRDDPATLAAAILALRMRVPDGGSPEQRLALVEEVLALPQQHLPPDLQIAARCYQHEDLLQSGDRAGADAALDVAAALVEEYPDPYWSWAILGWRAIGSIMDGELDRAEATAVEASHLQPGVPEATACLAVNVVNVRLLQGRAAEVVDLLAAAADAHPEIPCYRAVLALGASESGRAGLAERSYRWFADRGFRNLPEDTNRFLGLAVLAHVAADLGDRAGAAVLTGLLEPHRRQQVLLNCYGAGGATWGPAAHALARLAVVEGRDEAAEGLFAEALDRAAGSPLERARVEAHARAWASTRAGAAPGPTLSVPP